MNAPFVAMGAGLATDTRLLGMSGVGRRRVERGAVVILEKIRVREQELIRHHYNFAPSDLPTQDDALVEALPPYCSDYDDWAVLRVLLIVILDYYYYCCCLVAVTWSGNCFQHQ